MAPAEVGVTGLSIRRGATRAHENWVARSSAARRIRGPESPLEGRKEVSVAAEERGFSGVALVGGGFFRDEEPLFW
jgi:hypothetical protein